jgi:hypothetical protein
MKHSVPVSFCLVVLTGWLSADTPSSDLARARTLVERLASDEFATREQASLELRTLDKAAEPALREGITSADVEVRQRCGDLLALCQRTDLERALDAYLKKPDNRVFDQPWPRFAKVLGDTPEGRQLFQEMCLAEGNLLASLDRSPAATGEQLASRCQFLLTLRTVTPQGMVSPNQITLPQICALLYVASNPEVLKNTTNPYLVTNLLYRQEIRSALPGHPTARRLFVSFLEHSQPQFLYQNLHLAQIYSFKECAPWVLKLVQDKTQTAQIRGQALMALARLGGKEHIPTLEALLTDTTSLGQLNFQAGRVETQLRDVALAALVLLKGDSLEPYEFPFMKQNPHLLKQDLANLQLPAVWFGFANDEARAVAQKKYRETTALKKG